jgi:TolA-binding protein
MEQKVAGLTVFDRAWAWFESNKKQAALGAGIVVVVGVIVSYYVWSQGEKEISAGEAFSNAMASVLGSRGQANSADAFLKVAADYRGTSAGARALLAAAGSLFAQGKYAEAQTQFQEFNRDYPESPFRTEAMFGVAACLDAMGKADEAARAYKELIDRHQGDAVESQSKFALARIYESQNKLKEARELYESIVQDANRAPSYNSIVSEAAVKVQELRSKQPEPTTAQPATTAFPILSAQPSSKTNALRP